MAGAAPQPAREYRKPTPKEREHVIHYHIKIQISDVESCSAEAEVSVLGECGDPKCPVNVYYAKYCKRPPC